MQAIYIFIGAGWAAFWIYWLAASFGVKAGRDRWGRFAWIRIVVILVVFLLLRLHIIKGHHFAVMHSPWLAGTGAAVFVLGLALAVWARLYIGRNWGMPMTEKADPELVTTGPYAAIRHPIYSGILLGLAGTALAVSWYLLIGVAAVAAYFLYSAAMEERYMTKVFPGTYPRYKQSTKMLIPFVL